MLSTSPERVKNADTASSVVIGFVLLLVLVAVVLGVWAAVGLPEQLKTQDEQTLEQLERSFLQYKLAADILRIHEESAADVGIILPNIQGLTYSVTKDTGGRLSIIADDDVGNATVIPIGKVSAEFTGFSGERSAAAYEAGGVHLKTAGSNPAWITPAMLQISPVDPTAVQIEINQISFADDTEISGSGHLPVTLSLKEVTTKVLYWKDNATLRFESPDPEQRKLWAAVFFETKERTAKGTVYRTAHTDSFTLLVQTQERIPLFSIRQTDPLTLRIETSTNTTLSRVVLREAIYETGPAEIIYA
ncbi:MAG TPA: hypothetical protein O0X98_06810 [Methanocorpusculum sp.]|nr:hypothetical protein [Methanocorpusculum sp.]HJK38348.1 hypothetical protein [Methanocorpusculum sp.]HJK41757.1 hypothetical protein [Methanocorpusculum sp.]